MPKSQHLGLDCLAPAQAQKYITVNESFNRLDEIVQLTIQSRSLNEPPATPLLGDRFIVPSGQSAN